MAEVFMGNRARTHIPISEARIRHRLRPSCPSPAFLRFIRLAAPVYARFALHFTDIEIRHPERLVSVWNHFQQHESRLLLAFRHPYGDEPQLFSTVFDCLLAREARKMGLPLPERPHARLLHGYEVALWGDVIIRTVLPLSGALPVYHRKTDASGMKLIRAVLKDGPHPVALAPEGQVSYRSETLPRLEPGTMRMAFWCARDLEKEGRQEKTIVLPLSVHHQFDRRDIGKFMVLLKNLEKRCGLSALEDAEALHTRKAVSSKPSSATFSTSRIQASHADSSQFRQFTRERLIRIETALLGLAETHYSSLCGYKPPESGDVLLLARDNATRQKHWNSVMIAALEAGEHILGLHEMRKTSAEKTAVTLDSLIDRVYRIRHEGWERIYPMKHVGTKGQVSNAASHRLAGEAWYAMRHMEFVDLTAYLDTEYLDAEACPDGPSYDRLVETGLNLHDLSFRLMGGNFTNRDNTMRKKAIILTGKPIDVTAYLSDDEADWKNAASAATLELGEAFRQCIRDYQTSVHCL